MVGCIYSIRFAVCKPHESAAYCRVGYALAICQTTYRDCILLYATHLYFRDLAFEAMFSKCSFNAVGLLIYLLIFILLAVPSIPSIISFKGQGSDIQPNISGLEDSQPAHNRLRSIVAYDTCSTLQLRAFFVALIEVRIWSLIVSSRINLAPAQDMQLV